MSASVAVDGARLTPRTHSIQFWLRWLVLACALPAWAVTAWIIVASGVRERSARELSTIDTARALMQAVDRDLASSVVGLQTLATSSFLSSHDFAKFHRQASEALANFAGTNIVVLDRTGQQVINTSAPFGAPLPKQELGHRIVEVFQTARPTVTDLFIGPLDSQPRVGIVVPVIEQGAVIYVLGMGVSPEHFGESVYDAKLSRSWIAGIVDGAGTIVARTRNAQQFIGKKATPELIRKIAEVPEGVIDGETLEGMSVVVGFSRSTISGWTVGIAIPSAELMAPLYRSLRLTISVAAALFLLALMIAWLISSRIARSIGALNEPALSLASDAPVLVPRLAIREVNEIGGALMKASHLLKERRAAREDAAQKALRESEERLRLAVTASRMGMFDWDLRTGSCVWSDECYRMLGYQTGELQPSQAAWMARLHPDDREAAEAAELKAKIEHKEFISEYRIVRPDGSVRWVLAHGHFFYDADKPVRMIGLKQDITEARQQVATQRVLVAELQHRTRNLMAVVQSIAHQTLDSVGSFADFENRFNHRLEALSRVQSLLSRADKEPITVRALVVMELEALGPDTFGERITFAGADVSLRKSVVEMLSLAIHELLTNAIKYGALAIETGRLSVTWRIQETASDRRIELEWIERGIISRALVADANPRGYGRTLIEEALPYSLSAETKFELGIDSLRCVISLPLAPKEDDEE